MQIYEQFWYFVSQSSGFFHQSMFFSPFSLEKDFFRWRSVTLSYCGNYLLADLNNFIGGIFYVLFEVYLHNCSIFVVEARVFGRNRIELAPRG